MKDLRPPTCRTHSIVHTHATYTHLHTRIRYMCIYHACPTHIGRHTRSILFGDVMIFHGIRLQVFNEKKSNSLPLFVECKLANTYNIHPRARTHAHTHKHRHKHTRAKAHRSKTPRSSSFFIFAPTGFNCHGAIQLIE